MDRRRRRRRRFGRAIGWRRSSPSASASSRSCCQSSRASGPPLRRPATWTTARPSCQRSRRGSPSYVERADRASACAASSSACAGLAAAERDARGDLDRSGGRTITTVSASGAGSEPPATPTDDIVERAVAAAPWIALRAGVVVLALVLGVWFLFQVSSVLLLAFIAVILAAAIAGPVSWLEHRGVPGGLAVLAIYLVVALVLGLLLFLVAPPLLEQLTQLLNSLPAMATSVLDQLESLTGNLGLQPDLSAMTGTAIDTLRGATSVLAGIPLGLMGAIGDVLMILTLGAFIVLERRRARRWISRFLAPDDRAVFVRLVDKAALRLAAYVESQLLIMAVTGIGATVGLTLIGVPFALALGTFAFLTQIIPVVGPFIGGAAMIIVAFMQSSAQGLLTLVLVIGL